MNNNNNNNNMSNIIKCKPNYETGYVSLSIEIKDAPGIRVAYEYAENSLKTMIQNEFKDGRMDWAESRLAEKRQLQRNKKK